jgi:hypothetical protein
MPARSARNLHRAGLGVMLLASFVQVWITIVGGVMGEDNPQNQGFLGVVVTAWACAFVAGGKAEGMARAMLATAGVQALLGAMLATAPITERPGRVLAVCGVFCLMWLGAGALFRRSAQAGEGALTSADPPVIPLV